ncbi:MAG: tyrosine-type recombinase/integrase [Candidatus Methanofastidiosia archaeon]
MEIKSVAQQFYRYVQRKGLSETYCAGLKSNYIYIAKRCGTFPVTEDMAELVISMRERGLSASWILNILKTMKHLCAFLEIDMPKVSAPKDNGHRVVYLSEIEASRLLNACDSIRDYAILCIMLYGGLRRMEVTLLRWPDIDFENRLVTVTGSKTHYTAEVPIAPKAVEALAMWRKRCEGDIVFPGKTGDPLKPDRISRIVKKYARKSRLKKNVTSHVLRHTLATNLLLNGADVTLVQRQLRHRDIKSTMIYLHITTEKQKELYDRFSPDF